MLRGSRFIILAVAGLALAGANQPSKKSQAIGSDKQTQSASAQSAAPPEAPEPAYRPYPDKYAEACYNAEDHNSADLCAQWRAAFAAEKAASEAERATFWAIIATFLSAFGVAGLIYTLWQTHGALGEARNGNRISMKANARATRQAVSSAQETAKALEIAVKNTAIAEQQVLIAQESAQRQLRAYIKLSMRKNQVIGNIGEPIKIGLTATNYGKTPAQKAEFCYAIGIQVPAWNWSGDMVAEKKDASSHVLHNGGDTMYEITSDFILDENTASDIRAGKATVFARGTYFYEDVFGQQHITQIALEIRQTEIQLNRIRLAPTGNIAT